MKNVSKFWKNIFTAYRIKRTKPKFLTWLHIYNIYTIILEPLKNLKNGLDSYKQIIIIISYFSLKCFETWFLLSLLIQFDFRNRNQSKKINIPFFNQNENKNIFKESMNMKNMIFMIKSTKNFKNSKRIMMKK